MEMGDTSQSYEDYWTKETLREKKEAYTRELEENVMIDLQRNAGLGCLTISELKAVAATIIRAGYRKRTR